MAELVTRHERDYLERTIATVRNHRSADNCWPQWANIFADEIERLWASEERQSAKTTDLVHVIYQWRCQGRGEPLTLERIEEMVAALAEPGASV